MVVPNFAQSARLENGVGGAPKRMLEVERDGNQTLVRINSSSLSIIQACPRKARYLLHEKWQSKSASPPLVHGLAVHKALEVFYGQPREGRTYPVNFDEYARLMVHGHDAPEKHFLYDAVAAYIKAAEPLKALPDTDARSLSSGVWVLGHYFKHRINDEYVTYVDANGPVIERTFETPLFECADLRIVLFGTIDFALKNLATGHVLCGDHKTTSRFDSNFLNRIKPNHQYTGYIIGAQRVLGIATEDFLVNGVQVLRRPLTNKGGPPTFMRQITKRTDADFAEFTDTVHWAVRSYLGWEAANVWPLGPTDACASWNGCQFHDVCTAPNALKQNILESKFNLQGAQN